MLIFVAVVEYKSFVQAATNLGLTPSAISKTISRIEKRLNVKLFIRSTRNTRVTDAGNRYYEHCKKILSDIENAEKDLASYSNEASGRLKIKCGPGFALLHVADIASEFLKLYPKIQINIITPKKTDFYDDDIDVSFEFKTPKDSSLIIRRIHECPWTICTTAAYLKKHGTPKQPEDLKYHNCLIMSADEIYDKWRFKNGEDNYTVKVNGNFSATSLPVLKALLNDIGIARLPSYMVSDYIKNRKLLALFEENQPATNRDIYLTYPHRNLGSRKVKLFIDFAVKEMPKRLK